MLTTPADPILQMRWTLPIPLAKEFHPSTPPQPKACASLSLGCPVSHPALRDSDFTSMDSSWFPLNLPLNQAGVSPRWDAQDVWGWMDVWERGGKGTPAVPISTRNFPNEMWIKTMCDFLAKEKQNKERRKKKKALLELRMRWNPPSHTR